VEFKIGKSDELLPAAEFTYNNHVHSSTQQVLFMMDTGQLPRMGFEPNSMRSADELVNEFRDRIVAGVAETKAALAKAKDEFKLYYNHQHVPAPEIKVGDQVWVDVSDIKTARPSPKFSDKRLGPFQVMQVVGKGAYKLQLPPHYSQLHPVFPVVKLELVKPDLFPGRPWNDKPPPILQTDGDERWEVDEILKAWVWYGILWYMVRWKGYGPEHDKWVKHSDVFAKDAIDAYYHQYPNTPHQIASAAFNSLSFWRCDRTIRFIRWDTRFQGGGDVRGAPIPDALLAKPGSPGSSPDASSAESGSPGSGPDAFLAEALDTPVPVYLLAQPPGTSVRSRWHMLCDQAQDHCKYLQTHATG
jgi:hypothetical protein